MILPVRGATAAASDICVIFMDDLKLYAANDTNLTSLIYIVKTFSDDIRMSFGLSKCNKLTIIKGKVIH